MAYDMPILLGLVRREAIDLWKPFHLLDSIRLPFDRTAHRFGLAGEIG